jgi:putative membrane-bound dehydrogenase-like protein
MGKSSLLPVLLVGSTCLGQGYPADDAVKRMSYPDDVAVTLVASEPIVRQPVAIDFDDRGRLWVMQYMQYPNPEGLSRVAVDRYSRTRYDRVPDPPPKGPRGGDKLSILLDDNQDGRIDRAVDFVDGLNLASGFVHGRGGVFVLQVPYLLFYGDADGDDRPDGDPKVLLTGFGMEDAHSVANSLTWGPDGWLYGLQGSTCTAKIRGIEFQQGVWRYHVEKDRFELFAEGGGNMWGLDYDLTGQWITSTNLGGYTSMHAVQGGYYWKSFGKHGPLHNPYTFGYFDHIACAKFEGGHVSVGGTIYQGRSLPERYRGAYVFGNLLSHGVYQQRIERNGSTFRGGPTEEWIRSNDTWFASSDLCVGPDGAIYVADWHDRRMAHPDPDADWDRTNGRIYRIAGRESGEGRTEPAGLGNTIDRLMGSDVWASRRALRVLGDRPEPASIGPLVDRLSDKDDEKVLRALWGLYQVGGWSDERAVAMLDHASEDVRAWVIRWAGDEPVRYPGAVEKMSAVAKEESSPRVQCQLASSAKRLPLEAGLRVLSGLISHGPAMTDPHVPQLVWWGIEKHACENLPRTIEVMSEASITSQPIWREFLLPRLAKRAAADPRPVGWQGYEKLLREADPTLVPALLRSLSEAVDLQPASGPGADQMLATYAAEPLNGVAREGVRKDGLSPIPASLRARVTELWQGRMEDVDYRRAAIDAGIDEAWKKEKERAIDRNLPSAARLESLSLLSRRPSRELIEIGGIAIDAGESTEIQRGGMQLLSKVNDSAVAEMLLGMYSSADADRQGEIRGVLTLRPEWTVAFLKQVEAGKIDPASIRLEEVRKMVASPVAEVRGLVTKFWGTVRSGTPEEKLAEVRRLNNDLRAEPGDAANGKLLFVKHCGSCHQLFGEGGMVGPDLTHANRLDREFLLVSLVDPSLTVRKEYTSFVCEMADGRVLTGVVTQQEGESVTLVDSSARATTLPRGEIVELKESSVSVMPEDLYRRLRPTELRDLFAYITSQPTETTLLPGRSR